MQASAISQEKAIGNIHQERWQDYMRDCREILRIIEPLEIAGRITKLTGLVMEAVGIQLPIGCACYVPLAEGRRVEAEVVGFDGDVLLLMPQSSVDGVVPGAKVFALEIAEALPKPHFNNPPRRRVTDRARHLPVGEDLLGRVVDGAGNPLDNLGKIASSKSAPLSARPINPLMRAPIEETLDVGVRAINAMLTVGRGQRMGLFAGSGVGKSVLLGMMARYTTADVIVVGLIGERGREVQEFIENILGEEGLARSVVVAAPADASALMRLQGANYEMCIRDRANGVVTQQPQNPQQLSLDLKNALQRSGLFLESHLAEVVAGKRTIESMRPELQNLANNTPNTVLNTLPAQQLAALEHQRLSWHGEIWQNQTMDWDVTFDEPREHAEQSGQDETLSLIHI